MANKIRTLKPDKPLSGASIMKDSIAGRKTQFVQQTNTVSGPLFIPAGGIQVLTIGVDLWAPDLPDIARTANNLIPPSESVVWQTIDFYIDNDLNGHYYIGNGDLLSSDQSFITAAHFDQNSPTLFDGSSTITDSASTMYVINSFASSDHTVYYHVTAKYLVYGDVNL